mmetsp:Transcript_25021/g.51978  ORF Transcript_25021/g.51978 Transcript_25021/m.51978 type:complete len:327 (+) Transcript_25021:35-1015(+)
MDSLWKISKESSPLAHGLLERQPSKKTTQVLGDLRKDSSKEKLCAHKRSTHGELEEEREWELLRRVEQLLDDRAQRQLQRMEGMISDAVGRVGEAFGAQVEALRRDFSRSASRPALDDASSQAGSLPSTVRVHVPVPTDYGQQGASSSRGASPGPGVSHRGDLSTAGGDRRAGTEAQLAGLAARVGALQQTLAEVVVQQELHHIATGKFACTVPGFTAQELKASLQALTSQEAAAKERLRKLRKPSRSAKAQGSAVRCSSLAESRGSGSSSASGVSVATTAPATLHLQVPRRESIKEEFDDALLVELLPTERVPDGGRKIPSSAGS